MGDIVRFDPQSCSACWACTMTCVDEKDLCLTEHSPYILAQGAEDGGLGYTLLGCRHCADPACAAACPKGCITKTDLGLVVLDPASCVGCGNCIRHCPHGAIHLHQGRAEKCDGCIGRVRAGLRPACERICPSGALKFCFQGEEEKPYL